METLTLLEFKILNILEGHQGRENFIGRFVLVDQINHLCPLLPTKERLVRRTIKHLREQHGARIGSCGKGYFMAVNADEILAISKYHRGRAMSELVSAAKIERSSLAEMLGQLSLEIRG